MAICFGTRKTSLFQGRKGGVKKEGRMLEGERQEGGLNTRVFDLV